jgi:beta propeller repeat protein
MTAADGTEVREFTPFSIDRDVPVFISSAEREAQLPDVHGRRVVWQSPRGGDEDGDIESDLFAGVFGRTGERALVEAPGDQFRPAVSDRALAWLEFGRSGSSDRVVRACLFLGLRGRCRPFEASAGEGTRGAPQLSGRQLVFSEIVGGVASLYACTVGSGACRGGPIAPEFAGARAPVIDGNRVVWAGGSSGGALFECEIGPSGVCDPTPISTNQGTLDPVALSGRWLAAIGFASNFGSAGLFVCEVDFELGVCDAREVATFPSGLVATADLSGRRLAWHGTGAHGQPDVFLCTLGDDAECEPRALTNDAASQTHPRIDGDHLVWVDDRDGVPRVVSFDLGDMPRERERGKPEAR